MDQLLFRSLQTRKKLEMIYLRVDNRTSYRVIRVLGMHEDRVIAYCFTRKEVRTFKKDMILSIGPVQKGKMGA
ncbi:WYL domain-containing protein [Lentibacillus cibarius]|uniref:WYL domain-containing protein n=1 Tax=Lentibacillus cibarius TaxID=2583219 RepID=A0A5S3QMK5_9BACI|nr:WYL domain-containing protein [Lentibacillus cibarius]TMN23194.1 WYL domain-containing protein [Lentibacillus cibarius]